jgi:hypothetical protein
MDILLIILIALVILGVIGGFVVSGHLLFILAAIALAVIIVRALTNRRV